MRLGRRCVVGHRLCHASPRGDGARRGVGASPRLPTHGADLGVELMLFVACVAYRPNAGAGALFRKFDVSARWL
eukprot:11186370-Lingulodinium_polyedra.AAC.1